MSLAVSGRINECVCGEGGGSVRTNKDQTFSLQAEKKNWDILIKLALNPHLNSPLIFDRLDSINQCPFHTILRYMQEI